jgi:hypothetical protein
MSNSPRVSVSATHPERGDAVSASFTALYSWHYEPEIDQLRTLYANGLARQWIAMRDLDWENGIDREALTRTFSMGGLPVAETRFWRELPFEARWQVSRTSAAFMLSNFLHGEQGALMVAGQLVSAVPHMDGKFYAATQTLDEARHVEAFAAYIDLLGGIQGITPGLKDLLDAVVATDDWKRKAVGMQVVTEGLALYFFRDMRNQTQEPLLKQLLTYVCRDEARHTGYGIKYLGHVIPTLPESERRSLADFAFECTRMLMASRAGSTMRVRVEQMWSDAGYDPADVMQKLAEERDVIARSLQATGGRYGPVSGFIIPTLRALGLYDERVAMHFKTMWTETQGREAAERYASSDATLPDDLEQWVNEGYEDL